MTRKITDFDLDILVDDFPLPGRRAPTPRLTEAQLERARAYYDKGTPVVDETIKDRLKEDNDLTVYGAQSVNMQLPKRLQKATEDWDIYATGGPRKNAEELEKKLDERFGRDFFKVEPAKHDGTFRIRCKITKRVVADVTMLPTDVPTRKVAGIQVATLEHQVENIKKTLADPDAKFRWNKDKETLQRIMLAQKPVRKPRKKTATKRKPTERARFNSVAGEGLTIVNI